MAYVLDANIFIEAARRYYAFDIAPSFWQALLQQARDGYVLSIDRVKNEIERGNDELSKWVKNDFHPWFASTAEMDVVGSYRKVMSWVQRQNQFSNAARTSFASGADGWVIAYAISKGCIVVTHERFNPNIKRKVPIPNVCMAFKLKYVDTFQMLRDLGVRLP